MARKRARYYVLTYDVEKEDFTPQSGVRSGPYSLWGLRKVLRKLREFGYDGRRNDNSIYIYKKDG